MSQVIWSSQIAPLFPRYILEIEPYPISVIEHYLETIVLVHPPIFVKFAMNITEIHVTFHYILLLPSSLPQSTRIPVSCGSSRRYCKDKRWIFLLWDKWRGEKSGGGEENGRTMSSRDCVDRRESQNTEKRERGSESRSPLSLSFYHSHPHVQTTWIVKTATMVSALFIYWSTLLSVNTVPSLVMICVISIGQLPYPIDFQAPVSISYRFPLRETMQMTHSKHSRPSSSNVRFFI